MRIVRVDQLVVVMSVVVIVIMVVVVSQFQQYDSDVGYACARGTGRTLRW